MLGLYQAAVGECFTGRRQTGLERASPTSPREPERELWNFNQYAFHPGSIAA